MAKYLLAIVEDESRMDDEVYFGELMQAHQAFSKEVEDLGCTITSGEALQPASTATFFRGMRTPDVKTVDNPLPDVKEIFGGFYVIDAPDEATAQKVAERCPAPFGYVEMRPVMEFGA